MTSQQKPKRSNTESSQGLIELLERNGVKPTGNSAKDIKLAQRFMKRPYR